MSDVVKPCPHCAGTDIRFDKHVAYDSPTGEVWSMCCYTCGATFPNRYRKELLVEAWNKRPPISYVNVDEAARYLRLSISITDVEKQRALNVMCEALTRLLPKESV